MTLSTLQPSHSKPRGSLPSRVGCATSHRKHWPSMRRIGAGTTMPSERVKPALGESDVIETGSLGVE